MLFTSFQFFLFFSVVAGLYFLMPYKHRWIFLLVSSCYFYVTFIPKYILFIGFLITINYGAGIVLERVRNESKRGYFILFISINLLLLIVFKYFNFLDNNLTFVLNSVHVKNPFPSLSLMLPIGISFQIFQVLSYIIEVYYGSQKAERHFGKFALYVVYFPKLITGPIERPQNLLPQFNDEVDFDYRRITSGLRLMVWGLFKKIVIADRLAYVVDNGFDNPERFTGFALLVVAVFYTFQLYCDFSGYSDIAIGTSRILGIRLTINFRQPYFATSIMDFWRRWHISLSSWLLDYLFKPLQMKYRELRIWGNAVAILITFILSGVWHGASWTFIIWGCLHGLYLSFALLTVKFRRNLNKRLFIDRFPFIKMIITFGLVTFAWIFFRANDVHSAFYFILKIVNSIPKYLNEMKNFETMLRVFDISVSEFVTLICLIVFLLSIEYFQIKHSITEFFYRLPLIFRWAAYYVMAFVIIYLGVFGSVKFIYFKF